MLFLILPLLILIIIYIQFGLLVSIQIVIWTIVFIISNFLIGFNPLSRELYVIRTMAIIVIIFILYYNSKELYIASAFILPLSISNISFADEIIETEGIIQFDSNVQTERFHLFKVNETTDFLKN